MTFGFCVFWLTCFGNYRIIAVSRYIRNTDQCPYCQLTYERLRTNLSYVEVQRTLWVVSINSNEWRHKRRSSVLGKWHEIKQRVWKDHLDECEYNASRNDSNINTSKTSGKMENWEPY